MPSRHAHRAALRRFNEPSVTPPAGLGELPVLPYRATGWRNPVVGDDYDRTVWEIYQVIPGSSRVLASVQLVGEVFQVRSGGASAQVADPQAAFELAAGWTMPKLAP